MKMAHGVICFVVGAAAGTGVTWAVGSQQRAIEVTQLIRKDVEGCAGKEVSVSILAAGPGTSGDHYHPGESFTYVLEGTQSRQAAGEPTTTLGPGGFIYDGPAQVHRTENATPVKLLVFRLLDKGKPETTRIEK